MPIATAFRCGKAGSISASFWSSRGTSRGSLVWRTAWKISLSTSSCMRTKCSTVMPWAFRGTVKKNGRHGQHSFCWRTSSIVSVPCTTKKEGVVSLYRKTRKKKCLFMGLLQRAPRLVGSSRYPQRESLWWSRARIFTSDITRTRCVSCQDTRPA